MKSHRAIEIIIGTTGKIPIDAVGFKGPDCEQATKFREEALGVAGQKIKKPEYHQRGTRTNQQRIGGSVETATCKYCTKRARKRLISWVSTSKVHPHPVDHGPRCQDHLDEAMRRCPFSASWQWLERPLPDAY